MEKKNISEGQVTMIWGKNKKKQIYDMCNHLKRSENRIYEKTEINIMTKIKQLKNYS